MDTRVVQDIERLLNPLKDYFHQSFGVSKDKVHLAAKIDDLVKGFDSLDVVELVMHMEYELKLDIRDDVLSDLSGQSTITDVIHCIKQKSKPDIKYVG